MRKFKTIFTVIAFLSLALGASASDQLLNSLKPRYDYAVHDFANVISASDEQRMQSMIAELEQKTGAEVAVVTIPSLDGGQIDDFTTRLFEKWGVGQKGKDNGLMVLAAMSDREMRIEVGYGLEGAIPDSKAGRIRRDVITPYFKQNQPGKGLLAGVAVISQEIAKEYGVALTGEATKYRQSSTRNRSDKKQNPLFTIIFVIIFVIFAIRHPHLAMLLLLSGGRGGGGSSGGGFGGGSGGFGGGMSGGGGSSGGW